MRCFSRSKIFYLFFNRNNSWTEFFFIRTVFFPRTFQLDDEDNANYVEITKLLAKVSEPETSTSFQRLRSIKDLILPDLNDYYTYHGSLTTPPCSEVVTWIDFKQSIPLSHAQVLSSTTSLHTHCSYSARNKINRRSRRSKKYTLQTQTEFTEIGLNRLNLLKSLANSSGMKTSSHQIAYSKSITLLHVLDDVVYLHFSLQFHNNVA